MLDQAEAGDTTAAKIIIDRFVPTLKAFEHSGFDISRLPRMVVVPPTADKDTKDSIIDAEVVEPTEHVPAPPTAELNEKNSD